MEYNFHVCCGEAFGETVIGIIARAEEQEIVKEYFELFKTPWEFYREEVFYDVVISTCNHSLEVNASVLFMYDSENIFIDALPSAGSVQRSDDKEICYENMNFPVYNNLLWFLNAEKVFLRTRPGGKAVGFIKSMQDKTVVRIGYDIFKEIQSLFIAGQPAGYSDVPTLEIHIKIMRDMILQSGISVIEIPPVPAGYNYIACLTHDVDFAGIRNHFFDHTFLGFIYRATLGSFMHVLAQRISCKIFLKNLLAVLSLPLVYAGIIKDFLAQFNKYVSIESTFNCSSTFFIVPYRNNAGNFHAGNRNTTRAVKYDLASIQPEIKFALSKGFEVGVHGLDAWHDSDSGKKEFDRLFAVTKNAQMGIRMHWLYFTEKSPVVLDQAGFAYDSTCGYNDAIGFKAGTTQVYKPSGCARLLELPLHIQDTALFYAKRMNLHATKALRLVNTLLKIARSFGGVITINWHERSLGPERYWDKFYIFLLNKLRKQKAWMVSAGGAVAWFQARRAITFQQVHCDERKLHIKISSPCDETLPKFVLRIHPARNAEDAHAKLHARVARPEEICFSGLLDVAVSVH